MRGDEAAKQRQQAKDLGRAREDIARDLASLSQDLIAATSHAEVIAIRDKIVEIKRGNQEELSLAVDLSRNLTSLTIETGRRETELRVKESNVQAVTHLKVVDRTVQIQKGLMRDQVGFAKEIGAAETAEQVKQARARLDLWKQTNALIIQDNSAMATSLAGLYGFINQRMAAVLDNQVSSASDPTETAKQNESMMRANGRDGRANWQYPL